LIGESFCAMKSSGLLWVLSISSCYPFAWTVVVNTAASESDHGTVKTYLRKRDPANNTEGGQNKTRPIAVEVKAAKSFAKPPETLEVDDEGEPVIAFSLQAGGQTSVTDVDSLSPSQRLALQHKHLCLLKKYVDIAGIKLRTPTTPDGPGLQTVKGTCSVVSSSGVLRLHQHGHLIDAADAVMRFNLAPVWAHISHVGSRDDVRFVNEKVMNMWNHFQHTEMIQRETIYSASCTLCGIASSKSVNADMYADDVLDVAHMYPDVRFFASDLKLEYILHRVLQQLYGFDWSNAGVTTGAVGMAVALAVCDKVNAYGMAQSANSVMTTYHYWEPGKISWQRRHHKSFDAEKLFWRSLASNSLGDVDSRDIIEIPGLSQVNCPAI